jgi:hypothetical protein
MQARCGTNRKNLPGKFYKSFKRLSAAPTAAVTSCSTVGGHIGHGLYNFSVFGGCHGIDVYFQVDVVSAVK